MPDRGRLAADGFPSPLISRVVPISSIRLSDRVHTQPTQSSSPQAQYAQFAEDPFGRKPTCTLGRVTMPLPQKIAHPLLRHTDIS